jgi:hypothetical protein
VSLACSFFGHRPRGPLPSRCVRCDEPMALRIAHPPRFLGAPPSDKVSPAEAVLLEALGRIRDLGSSPHDVCQHPSCIAARAITKYWEVSLAPFGEPSPSAERVETPVTPVAPN